MKTPQVVWMVVVSMAARRHAFDLQAGRELRTVGLKPEQRVAPVREAQAVVLMD